MEKREFQKLNTSTVFLVIILFLAAFLRFFQLGEGEILTDEVFYGFRAIELIDFVESDHQPTPIEWFDPDIPSWTKYSFHDHPPLVFLVQHASVSLFGETPFAIRFPSALLGVLSVLLVYVIGVRFFDRKAALIGAAFLAFTVSHVHISRLALQEFLVLFFVLLTLYALFRSINRETNFILLGFSLGLALLTKFTSLILIPAVFASLYIFKRAYLYNKWLWRGMLITILLFTPVLYYNFQLYQAVGHFDFQFSYLFGQNPDIWKVAPGKEIGTLGERLKEFLPNLFKLNSWTFLLTSFTGIAYSLYVAKEWKKQNYLTIIGTLIPLTFLIVFSIFLLYIGPSFRFLSILTPVLALVIIPFAHSALQRNTNYIYLFFLLLLFEIAFSINTFFIQPSLGSKHVLHSIVQNDTYQWGYGELGNYLDDELSGRMPYIYPTMTYEFLNALHEERIEKYKAEKDTPYKALILYDENVYYVPQLWYLDRLQLLHAWPVMKIGSFLERNEANPEFIDNFDVVYTVISTDNALLQFPLTDSASKLETELEQKNILPVKHIFNESNEESLRIYKYSPKDLKE